MLTPLTSGCSREEEVERGGKCSGGKLGLQERAGFRC